MFHYLTPAQSSSVEPFLVNYFEYNLYKMFDGHEIFHISQLNGLSLKSYFCSYMLYKTQLINLHIKLGHIEK